MKTSLTLLALACGTSHAFAADFGKEDLDRQGRLVFEKTFSPAEVDHFKQLTLTAIDNIVAFYGERKGVAPDFYFCKSKDCARFLLGPEFRSYSNTRGGRRYMDGNYVFEGPSVIVTTLASNPKARDERLLSVLTHELSHLETYARAAGHPVPAWFNEGLASMVGGKDCKADAHGIDDLSRLAVMKEWLYYTRPSGGQGTATYCQAMHEVQAWTAKHGGSKSIVELLAKLPEQKFIEQYGAFASAPAPMPVASAAAAVDDNDR